MNWSLPGPGKIWYWATKFEFNRMMSDYYFFFLRKATSFFSCSPTCTQFILVVFLSMSIFGFSLWWQNFDLFDPMIPSDFQILRACWTPKRVILYHIHNHRCHWFFFICVTIFCIIFFPQEDIDFYWYESWSAATSDATCSDRHRNSVFQLFLHWLDFST